MLSFIRIPQRVQKTQRNLNTSHVIFYPSEYLPADSQLPFKYISCYLLSRRHIVKIYVQDYLNTSHVIFYRGKILHIHQDTLI